MNAIKLTECPRDAMQGLTDFIPTDKKIEYLNQLLKIGFDRLDFGSFVSPKAIPQLRDTHDVVKQLDKSSTKLLAIVANERGVEESLQYDNIDFLGFPFSISEQFQQRNTNASREDALMRIANFQSMIKGSNKALRIYASMSFGNPYQEEWSADIVVEWCKKLEDQGINEIVLSDTTGVSRAEIIKSLFNKFSYDLPQMKIECHFHSKVDKWEEKIVSAFNEGCRGFDSAINGIGGCPMADDDLVGNIATENLIAHFNPKTINQQEWEIAKLMANSLFTEYH